MHRDPASIQEGDLAYVLVSEQTYLEPVLVRQIRADAEPKGVAVEHATGSIELVPLITLLRIPFIEEVLNSCHERTRIPRQTDQL